MFLQYAASIPSANSGSCGATRFVCAAIAIGLFIAADPLIILWKAYDRIALNGKAQPQNIVDYFLNATQASDKQAVSLHHVRCRASLRPWRRKQSFAATFTGSSSATRAASPPPSSARPLCRDALNVSSPPALFVLALCLTLAYEATGSLLVNIFMHGLFNLSMLLRHARISSPCARP